MRGITIILGDETIHTGNDLDLVQEKKEIGKPTVQTYTAQVPGRNGLLNLTKGLTGKVTYFNRPLAFQYFGTGSRERLLELDEIVGRYHGETIQIIDDDYPGHFYEGEATVSTAFHGRYMTITLNVNAQPFRLKLAPTVISRDLSGSATITLQNESIEAVPTITVTAETTIIFNGASVRLSAGTYVSELLTLKRGANVFEVTGTGRITIQYQEGAI